jgi:hypothetical protein
LARTIFTVLLRVFARALVPALRRVDRRNTAPVSARPGSLSSAFLAPFPRLLLTLVESEQVPSKARRSIPRDSASPSAVWQCSFERSHEHWSQLGAEWIAETGTSFDAKWIAQLCYPCSFPSRICPVKHQDRCRVLPRRRVRFTSASSSVGTNAIHSGGSAVRTSTSTGPSSASSGSPSSAPVSS